MTRAETWDRRIERAEWLWATAEELDTVVDFDEAFKLLSHTRQSAKNDSVSFEPSWSRQNTEVHR